MYQCIREVLFDEYEVRCCIEKAGEDYMLGVFGGDTPHIGSVVMAVSRPSLSGEGVGVTSSVLNSVGHKDEEIARWFAESLAVKMQCTVVCACGIHIDHITQDGIMKVKSSCQRFLDKVEHLELS